MKRMLIGCFVLLGAGPVGAQPPAADRTAMYEDVEVMRRLLADAVGRGRGQAVDYAYPMFVDPLANTVNLNYHPSLHRGLFDPRTDSVWVNELLPYVDANRSRNSNAQTALYSPCVGDRPRTPPTTDGPTWKGAGPVFTVTRRGGT